MTRMRIDAEEVVALGTSLREIADALEASPDASVDRWAFGGARSAAPLDEVIGGWRHLRLALVGQLRSLADGAAVAGGAYVDAEVSVAGRLLVGGPQS